MSRVQSLVRALVGHGLYAKGAWMQQRHVMAEVAGGQAQVAQSPGRSGAADMDGTARRVYIETYGCQMNVNDSEIIQSLLSSQGFQRTTSESDADVVLLNTCAIREQAEARIWGRLYRLRDLKRQRRAEGRAPPVVGVLGCMAERLKASLLERDKLVDMVVGPDAYRDLPRLIQGVQGGQLAGPAAMNVALSLEETYADVVPVRPAGAVSAFVSIMRGCNNMCSFCIVPHTRGRERSRPMESILSEVRQLAAEGAREVILLGQNVNSYADWSHVEQQQQQQTAAQALVPPSPSAAGRAAAVGSGAGGSRVESSSSSSRGEEEARARVASRGADAAGHADASVVTATCSVSSGSSHTGSVQRHSSSMMSDSGRMSSSSCSRVTGSSEADASSSSSSSSASGRAGSNQLSVGQVPRPPAPGPGPYAPGFSSVYRPRRAGATTFGELLRAVALVDPEMRIRFTSPHPKEFNLEVLQVIAQHHNICKQLHMPAQSGSTAVLQRMHRGYSRKAYDSLVADVHRTLPGVALSTDIIVGFCGETEEDHLRTLDLMRCMAYDNAFIFAYSQRDKTHAARHLTDDVSSETKARRLQEVLAAYREALDKRNRQEVGRVHLVLVESTAPKYADHWVGRTCTGRKAVFPRTAGLAPSLGQYPGLDELVARATAAGHTGASSAAEALRGGAANGHAAGQNGQEALPMMHAGGGCGGAQARAAAATAAEPAGTRLSVDATASGEAVAVVGPHPSCRSLAAAPCDATTRGRHLGAAALLPGTADVRPGSYVAVLVKGFRSATLICDPLACTSMHEFACAFGSTVPLGRVGAVLGNAGSGTLTEEA